ncbi:MAG: metallophosphoesterase family protein [Cyclobacteriaceae bacterium]|nr:metallophosphoesterase family protein [Cyclobacteriaceae bacterium]
MLHGFFAMLKLPLVFLLRRPVLWLSKRISASPDRDFIFERLTEVYQDIVNNKKPKHGAMYDLDLKNGSTIIFSDHHKGNRGRSDEFRFSEKNYLAALEYYDARKANYINLGDSEEFWKFNIFSIIKHNKATFDAEKKFVERNAFYKIYGNHDLFWKIDPFANMFLREVYDKTVNIYGGIVIRIKYDDDKHIDVFCTHGHQGDRRSDGNQFSIWFVSYIWAPLQAFLDININTPANVQGEKTLHNRLMYEWSQAQQNLILITGHTHQPIFHSYRHIHRLREKLEEAKKEGDALKVNDLVEKIKRHPSQCDGSARPNSKYKPTYFNTGCCCYSDNSITGIEISDGNARLVIWKEVNGRAVREILEELPLIEIKHMFFG